MTRLIVSLFAVLTSAMTWAQDLTSLQKEGDIYLIQSLTDWNTLADYVATVAADNNCSGLTFKMTADIGTSANPVTKPLGRQVGDDQANDRKRFKGTFDGDGHTLTIALNTDDEWFKYNKKNYTGYCAPFVYTQDATIKNLHVAGTVKTTGQWASGLVGSTGNDKEGTVTIDNCQVSVAITAKYISNAGNNKYGNHGGFVGIAEDKATITNSWFDGKFLGKDYMYSAGFIGLNKGKETTLSNCLFNPSEINIDGNKVEGSCEFVHDMNGGTHTFGEKIYWAKHFGDPENAQGQKVVASLDEAFDGLTEQQYAHSVSKVTAADGETYYIVKHHPTWESVQVDLSTGTSTVFNFSQTLTAGTEDVALVVPEGKNVTFKFDSNGALDRGLMDAEKAVANGYVIKVEQGATLTINGGTITGGRNTSNGGGIYNAGTLNINGTTITSNITEGKGGGIYNEGTLNINGTTITGNVRKSQGSKGVGVYVASGTLNVQGKVQITDNLAKYNQPYVQVPHNVYLESPAVINIVGTLNSGSSIGVEGPTLETAFTSGLSNADISMFFSDNVAYTVKKDNAGEAYLYGAMILANDANNSELITKAHNTTLNVQLEGRTLYKDGAWNTLCLPFQVDISNGTLSGDGVKAMTLESATFAGGTLTLNFVDATTISAGTPFIIKWNGNGTNNIQNPKFNDVKIDKTARNKKCTFSGGYITFTGTYTPVIIGSKGDKTKLYLGGDNTLYCPNGAMTIGCQRAYFQLSGIEAGTPVTDIKAFALNFSDETGIQEIVNGKSSNGKSDEWFDLSGRKLEGKPAQKGIYISNGRKVLIQR